MNTSISQTSEPTTHPGSATRSRAMVWLGRLGLALIALSLALALSGATYQAIAAAQDANRYPPPGQLVDVGGYQLHLYCLGEGSPTIILDAANMGTVSNWAWIQPELAHSTRVCAYDRAGNGWSDLSPEPQDTWQNGAALHTLLAQAAVPGPYLLVGHSFGGLFVQAFADMYPDEVVGMVLIEGTLPNGQAALGLPDVMPNAPDAAMIDATPFISRLGILRLLNFPPTDPDLPEPQRQELQTYLASSKWAETTRRQYHLFPTLLAQVRPLYTAVSLGQMPLAVVLGSEGAGSIEAWRDLFAQQAALSANGAIYRIEGASHNSLVDRQDHAAETRAVIELVLAAVRHDKSR
ncbi:MAG TPA: alpha/beta hydrolase [Chloroflexota bacterium]|nr:alpha/beta hydrolase [Chloroflexota bacterium]